MFCVSDNHYHRGNASQVYPMEPINTDEQCLLRHWQIIPIDSNHRAIPDSYEDEVNETQLQKYPD